MSNAYDNMKVKVMTTPAEDALQIALSMYDDDPDPRRLIVNRNYDSKVEKPEELPKHFSQNRTLMDLNLGEQLGMGVLAQYFRSKDNAEYDLITTVEDSWHPHTESIISDGALIKHGTQSRMIVQQVMAQDIAGKESGDEDIEDTVIKRIAEKNERMKNGDYPKTTALLVSIYSNNQTFNLGKVMREADLSAFPSYYAVRYRLPKLDQCHIHTLGGSGVPTRFRGDSGWFILQRYENPYEKKD